MQILLNYSLSLGLIYSFMDNPCSSFSRRQIEIPDDDEADSDGESSSCPLSYTKLSVPLFALEQDKLRMVDIDQNTTQFLNQEFCDVLQCREAGIQCHQVGFKQLSSDIV